jgi:hypothetical protein
MQVQPGRGERPAVGTETAPTTPSAVATHCCDMPARNRTTLFGHSESQADSSMPASPRLGCAMGVVQLAQLVNIGVGAIGAVRPSDRGPRRRDRDATWATSQTRRYSGYCAACHALQIHRYIYCIAWRRRRTVERQCVTSDRSAGSEWRCVMSFGSLHEDVSVARFGCVAMLCNLTSGCELTVTRLPSKPLICAAICPPICHCSIVLRVRYDRSDPMPAPGMPSAIISPMGCVLQVPLAVPSLFPARGP